MVKLFTKFKKFNIFALFFLIACATYFPALKGEFLLDDEHFIEKNQYVHELNVKKIYTSSVTEGAGKISNFYRPNQQLVYSIL